MSGNNSKISSHLIYWTTFCLLITISLSNFAQKGIQFEKGHWKDILLKAKKENKVIFLAASTSDCRPCKWMEKNVFTNDSVGKYYNQTFINVKMDLGNESGRYWDKKFNIKGYPTFLFIQPDEKILVKSEGKKTAQDFIKLGKNLYIIAAFQKKANAPLQTSPDSSAHE